jgi:flavodoxin
MKFQVIYFSKKGHTKKIAEAMASELNVTAEDVKDAQLDGDALVFLGSGCYGGKPAKTMTQFIQDNSFNSRDVALFGTSGSGDGVEANEMENLLKSKDARIKGRFSCKGQFLFANRGRPNDEDVDEPKKFAHLMRK